MPPSPVHTVCAVPAPVPAVCGKMPRAPGAVSVRGALAVAASNVAACTSVVSSSMSSAVNHTATAAPSPIPLTSGAFASVESERSTGVVQASPPADVEPWTIPGHPQKNSGTDSARHARAAEGIDDPHDGRSAAADRSRRRGWTTRRRRPTPGRGSTMCRCPRRSRPSPRRGWCRGRSRSRSRSRYPAR